jgi:hypothetical protein
MAQQAPSRLTLRRHLDVLTWFERGRLEAAIVRSGPAGDPLLAEVERRLAFGPTENWLASAETAADLRFLPLPEVPT